MRGINRTKWGVGCIKWGGNRGLDMKPFLTWLILGTCLLLFGCQDTAVRQDREAIALNFEVYPGDGGPLISYCDDMETFYNDGFAFTPGEDVELFRMLAQEAIDKKGSNYQGRLTGSAICDAMLIVTEYNEAEFPSRI